MLVLMRPVSTERLVRVMTSLGGDRRARSDYPAVAQAIARGAFDDPLFPGEDAGAEATAAILLAIAWSASKCRPYGREGRMLGLYRIRPPVDPPVLAQTLLLPRTATLIALDIARYSLSALSHQPVGERLAIFRDLGRAPGTYQSPGSFSADTLAWSRATIEHAKRLFPRISADRRTGGHADWLFFSSSSGRAA